jgi:hypothetical protein
VVALALFHLPGQEIRQVHLPLKEITAVLETETHHLRAVAVVALLLLEVMQQPVPQGMVVAEQHQLFLELLLPTLVVEAAELALLIPLAQVVLVVVAMEAVVAL